MTSSKSGIGAIAEDISVSFKFAFKNVISFFLGMLGVLIVTVIFVVIMLLIFIVSVIFLLPGGIWAFIDIFVTIIESLVEWPSPTSLGLVVLLLVPLLLPIFVAIGALYGMAREIVESDGTTAEGVFTWYSRRFFPLAGGGLVIFLVTIAPLAMLYGYAFQVLGGNIDGMNEALLIATAVVWFVVTTGLLSMMLPGIIDGLTVKQAVARSFKMGVKYLDRVFSVWLLFLILIFGLIAPLIWPWEFFRLFGVSQLGFYPPLAILFAIFIVIPAMAIAQSRVYLILSSEEDEIPVTDEGIDEPEKWGANN
ncbi:MAG: hypothetical protein ACXABV_05300 [Candidatus Thorarchaeota archaeon]|jgi:hypothetical protein